MAENRQVGRFALGWLDEHVPLDSQKHRGHGGDLAPPVGLSELAVEKRNGCKIAFGSFLFLKPHSCNECARVLNYVNSVYKHYVDSFAPAQLALRAAFGSLSRPFPKVSILSNPVKKLPVNWLKKQKEKLIGTAPYQTTVILNVMCSISQEVLLKFASGTRKKSNSKTVPKVS